MKHTIFFKRALGQPGESRDEEMFGSVLTHIHKNVTKKISVILSE
jgi:hypothetical protein